MLRLEVIRLLRLDIDDANHAVLGDQRHRQLRAHVGISVDVVFRSGDVVHQLCLAALRHLAHNALPHADAHPLDLRLVPDLEAHAQIVGAVVDQQNGEDAVVDDRTDQGCGVFKKRLEVERGVQRVGQADQEFRLQRIDVHLGGALRCLRRNGPVIPFPRLLCRVLLGVFAHDSPAGARPRSGRTNVMIRCFAGVCFAPASFRDAAISTRDRVGISDRLQFSQDRHAGAGADAIRARLQHPPGVGERAYPAGGFYSAAAAGDAAHQRHVFRSRPTR